MEAAPAGGPQWRPDLGVVRDLLRDVLPVQHLPSAVHGPDGGRTGTDVEEAAVEERHAPLPWREPLRGLPWGQREPPAKLGVVVPTVRHALEVRVPDDVVERIVPEEDVEVAKQKVHIALQKVPQDRELICALLLAELPAPQDAMRVDDELDRVQANAFIAGVLDPRLPVLIRFVFGGHKQYVVDLEPNQCPHRLIHQHVLVLLVRRGEHVPVADEDQDLIVHGRIASHLAYVRGDRGQRLGRVLLCTVHCSGGAECHPRVIHHLDLVLVVVHVHRHGLAEAVRPLERWRPGASRWVVEGLGGLRVDYLVEDPGVGEEVGPHGADAKPLAVQASAFPRAQGCPDLAVVRMLVPDVLL
mmetsp:Transcript_51533/g.137861  ORF Transcript_51533/g.137861 Transcript_51533/m.137861 type:complete len:357 (+) Transcript_51533:343-1413(+)